MFLSTSLSALPSTDQHHRLLMRWRTGMVTEVTRALIMFGGLRARKILKIRFVTAAQIAGRSTGHQNSQRTKSARSGQPSREAHPRAL